MVALGAVTIRIEDELLGPLIDRTMEIATHSFLKNGVPLLPPPPREIQGMDIKVEYISMLAQVAKQIGTKSIEQTFSFAGNLAGAFPQVLDMLDVDAGIKQYADMVGVDPHIVRSQDEVDAIRQQKAQAQQEAQQQQQMGQAVQGAQVLANTPVGRGGTALDNALQSITGAPPQAAPGGK